MAFTVDQWSPFMSLQKEEMAKQAGVKKWEDIFLQPYETAAQNVQTQAAYDISGAFAQYKKSELNALRNTQLGSGFKEQIASDLANQYASAFSQIKQQEVSDVYGLQQKASETLASAEAQLQESSKSLAGLEEAAFEQYGIDVERARASENAVVGKDENGNDIYGLGYYELQPDGSYKITEKGKVFWDQVFNQGFAVLDEEGNPTGEYEQFGDYLKNTGREDLYDFYVQNMSMSKKFIGDVTTNKYNAERAERLELNTKHQQYIDPSKANDIEYLRNFDANATKIDALSYNNAGALHKELRGLLNNIVPKPSEKGSVDSVSVIGNGPYDIGLNSDYMTDETIQMLLDLGFVQTPGSPEISMKFKTSADLKAFLMELNKKGVL